MDLTRKQAITGLAGILATGVAPAAFVRSMVGARGVAFGVSGSNVPTARDYVQDGLIAMWDGIENVGYGVHSSTTRLWKDLVGDASLTIPDSGISVGDNCYYFSNGKTMSVDVDDITLYENSIEIVCRRGNVNYSSPTIRDILKTSPISIGFRHSDGLGRPIDVHYLDRTTDRYRDYSHNEPTSVLHSYSASYKQGESAPNVYIDSEHTPIKFFEPWTQQGSFSKNVVVGGVSGDLFTQSSSYDGGAAVCSIRIYNRIMSNIDISTNYAIDKARFGLT